MWFARVLSAGQGERRSLGPGAVQVVKDCAVARERRERSGRREDIVTVMGKRMSGVKWFFQRQMCFDDI